MSVGPLLSELALSTENSLFDKIGLVLTYVLVIAASIVVLIAGIKFLDDRHKDKSDPDN